MNIKNCLRCNNPFLFNPMLHGDDVCPTCERMNDITFWYPRLARLNFPMPKTIIVHTNCDLEEMLDGKNPNGFKEFIEDLKTAINRIGLPCFLRTGMASNKWDWESSCFITDLKKLPQHIFNIVEFSAIATIDRFMSCDFWAVRELIKTKPYFYYFKNMPITKERRFFVRNGKIECSHPYWDVENLFKGIEKEKLEELNKFSIKDQNQLNEMAQYITDTFQGYWSCDFLQDIDGKWWMTDMAIGEKSFHQPHKK